MTLKHISKQTNSNIQDIITQKLTKLKNIVRRSIRNILKKKQKNATHDDNLTDDTMARRQIGMIFL